VKKASPVKKPPAASRRPVLVDTDAPVRSAG
jgi:hypothetical protein